MSSTESEKSDTIDDEPWAYIYLTPQKTGDKEKNELVPASHIKDFDYNCYCDNQSYYKNKPLKYKPGLRIKSRECVIHCARETKVALEKYLKSRDEKGKRFPKPKLQEHLSFTGSTDVSVIEGKQSDSLLENDQDENQQIAAETKKKQAKKARKAEKAAKNNSKRTINETIVEEYVSAMKKSKPADGYTPREDMPSDDDNDESTITALKMQMTEKERQHAAATRAYKIQIEDFKNMVCNLKKENQELKIILEQRRSEEDGENHYTHDDVKTSLAEYDKMFHREFILNDPEHAKEATEDGRNIFILRKGVKGNQKAYLDAFAKKKTRTIHNFTLKRNIWQRRFSEPLSPQTS